MKLGNVNYAILDQCCISGSNFFISLILARALAPEEFGLYVFAISILTFCVGLMNSIVSTPISVFGSSAGSAEWKNIVTSSGALYFGTLLTILIGLISVAQYLKTTDYYVNGNTIGVISWIVAFFLSHELIRRILIARLQIAKALFLDIVAYSLRIGLIVIMAFFVGLQCKSILYLIGITSAIGAAFGITSSVGTFKLKSEIDNATLGKIWGYGKWTLADWVPFVISGQLYIYIVAFLLGNSANGMLGACRNLIAPVSILMVGIMNFALPFFSKIYRDSGHEEFLRLLKKCSYLIIGLVVFYLSIISLNSENLLQFLFGKYGENSFLVSLFSIGVFFNFVFKPADIYLKVILKPRAVFQSRIFAATVSGVLCYPLVNIYGMTGAVLCYVSSQVTMCLFMYIFSGRYMMALRKNQES